MLFSYSVSELCWLLCWLFHSDGLPVDAVGAETPGHSVPPGVCVHQTDLLWVPRSQRAHQEGSGAVRAQHQHDWYIQQQCLSGTIKQQWEWDLSPELKLMTDCTVNLFLSRCSWQKNSFPAELLGSADPGGQQEPRPAWPEGQWGHSHPHTSGLPTKGMQATITYY